MRLWHEKLIPALSDQRLLGQHRECCALRGKGWNRPHSTVNYVFTHDYNWLVLYHLKVISEMDKRGFHVDEKWRSAYYRGKKLEPAKQLDTQTVASLCIKYFRDDVIYPEHNDTYLKECIKLLKERGEKL